MKDVHIGKKIKAEVYAQKMQITEFATKIQRSRNVVYDIFTRDTIDTGLLRIISNALNYDFFNYYINPRQSKQMPATKQNIDELIKLIESLKEDLKRKK